jgi:hypothetical protein
MEGCGFSAEPVLSYRNSDPFSFRIDHFEIVIAKYFLTITFEYASHRRVIISEIEFVTLFTDVSVFIPEDPAYGFFVWKIVYIFTIYAEQGISEIR